MANESRRHDTNALRGNTIVPRVNCLREMRNRSATFRGVSVVFEWTIMSVTMDVDGSTFIRPKSEGCCVCSTHFATVTERTMSLFKINCADHTDASAKAVLGFRDQQASQYLPNIECGCAGLFLCFRQYMKFDQQ